MSHAYCSLSRLWIYLILPVFLTLTAFLGGCNQDISMKDIQEISLNKVVKLRAEKKADTVLLIDARSPREFGQRRIKDARNIPLESTTDRRGDTDPALEKYSFLVVYGDDPGSVVATAVTKRLMYNGYGDIFWFKGGLMEWTRAGLPLEGFAIDTAKPR